MAAPTQTEDNKSGISLVGVATDEATIMIPMGGVYIGVGTGTPHSEVTAPKGSLFIELSGPDLYMNTNGADTWELVGAQSA